MPVATRSLTAGPHPEAALWAPGVECPNGQRNPIDRVTGKEGFLGEPGSNPKANSYSEVMMAFS